MNAPRILSVRPRDNFVVEVTWRAGGTDAIDLSGILHRLQVFAPLRDQSRFEQVRVDDWGWSISWDDGIDLSADSLRQMSLAEPND